MCKLFESIFENHQNRNSLNTAFTILRERGLINEGELAEQAISQVAGIAQCRRNKSDIDLVNGVQIKHALTSHDSQAYTPTAWVSISKARSNVVDLFVVVTETLTNEEYFFIIDYDEFEHLSGNTIGIPFELDGTPRYTNRWWNCRVSWDDFIQSVRDYA